MNYKFDGETYDPPKDQKRLSKQLDVVRNVMMDGRWRSLSEIAAITHFPEASISARLRDLRKPRFGSWQMSSRRRAGGCATWEYRLQEGFKPGQLNLL